MSAGFLHTCAVNPGGTVTCWGDNTYGQTTVAAGLTGVTQVDAGDYHTCAVTNAAGVVCWGAVGGDVNSGQATVPAAAQSGVTQVGAGHSHSCALTAAGSVVCWGIDNDGETNVPAAAQSGVTQLTVGNYHTCALTSDGTVSCWGYNGNFMGGGQLNVPVTTSHVAPSATFGAPTSATAGQAFTLALTGAQVPGHPAATAFTYAFDCGTGIYGAASSAPNTTCSAAAAGPLAVRGKVIDQDGDTAAYGATVNVGKAAQTVAFTTAAPSPAYVGATYTVSATATSGLAVTFTSLTPTTCTVAGNTVHFVGAGACTVAADQAGTAAYAAAPRVTQAVTVATQSQTITFTSAPPNPARVGGTYTVGAAVSSYFVPAYSSLTPATCAVATAYVGAPTATVTFTAAGTCVVAADVGATAVYAAAPEVTQTIAVVAAVPSFPATPVLDAFDRADGALGPNWGGFAGPAFFRVSAQHGAVGLGGGIGWAPTAFGTNQEAFVTLTGLGANGGGAQGLVLKGQDPASQALGALTVTYAPQRGTVTVSALKAPPAAGTAYPALAARFAAGDQLGARVTAAGVVTVYRNGVRLGTVTLNAADQAYFAGRGGYVGLVDVAANGALFDDFGGGSVGP